jgi:hypothetical protein
MIENIIDRRNRHHRWKRINAIVEPTWHDNDGGPDRDQSERGPDDIVYDQQEGISLAEAIAWANSLRDRVTLYLYDDGRGTTLWPRPLAEAPR